MPEVTHRGKPTSGQTVDEALAVIAAEDAARAAIEEAEAAASSTPAGEGTGTLPAAPATTEGTTQEAAQAAFDLAALKAHLGTAELSPEVLDALTPFFERADHDTLKAIKPYNVRLKQLSDDLKKQMATEQEKARADEQLIVGWDKWFSELKPEQIIAVQENEGAARTASQGQFGAAELSTVYDAVRDYRRTKGGAPRSSGANQSAAVDQATERMMAGFVSAYRDDPDLAPIADRIEDLSAESKGDPVVFARLIGKHAVQVEKKAMEQDFTQKIDALREEMLATRHGSASDGPAAIPGQVSTGGGMTYEDLRKMPLTERETWKRANPGLYDEITRAIAN